MDSERKVKRIHYTVEADDIVAEVSIVDDPNELIGTYTLSIPEMDPATAAFYEDVKNELLKKITINTQEYLDIKLIEDLKRRFRETSMMLAMEKIPHLTEKQAKFITGRLVQEMLGLGDVEFFLNDDMIEEICINNSMNPIWVYHKEFGWLKTNINIPSESQIWNYSSMIARRVGRQITVQTPLLDAYLVTGDRVNATLSPISSMGNTITIRKFARKPWTIVDFIKSKTMSTEVAAFLWLAIQYESSIIIAGGTGSGKTSLLNVISSFIPSNQRTISIEQTREVVLPSYLQWVPLVVREATTEGKGEVTMLDLLVNSLRMRPDRIIVGEIRRTEEAEVLFEAIHTGHSVYATMHAETVSEAIRRLASPPISLPPVVMESLPLVVSMFRDRRTGIRRIFEVSELIPNLSNEEKPPEIRIIFRWNPSTDVIEQVNPSVRVFDNLKRFTSMNQQDIENSLKERVEILNWIVKQNMNSVEEVAHIFSTYYRDPEIIIKKLKTVG
jgi:flagellar protein FlaI